MDGSVPHVGLPVDAMQTDGGIDRNSTRLNSSHTVIYTLSLHDALPILQVERVRLEVKLACRHGWQRAARRLTGGCHADGRGDRSEQHTSELQSHRDLHSFPTRRSSDLAGREGSAGGEARLSAWMAACRTSAYRWMPCRRTGG